MWIKKIITCTFCIIKKCVTVLLVLSMILVILWENLLIFYKVPNFKQSSQKYFHKLPKFWKKVENSTWANQQGKVKIFYSKASQDQLWKAGDLLNSPLWHLVQGKIKDNYCSNHYFSLPISFTINVPCNSKICVPFPCHLLKRGKRADSPGLEISSLSSDWSDLAVCSCHG